MKYFFSIILFFMFTTFSNAQIVDCEIHYVDFNQQTEGLDTLLVQMDKADISTACIMGLPLQKIWDEHNEIKPKTFESDNAKLYYYSMTDVILAEALLKLPTEQRKRFKPLISGFNPVDKNAIDHIQRMVALYPDFWAGIGEILTRHDILSGMTYGVNARADHPALMKVYQYATEMNLPVVLHSNITSTREKKLIYLDEITNTLKNNKNTTFIWAHAGMSANIERRQHIKHLDGIIEESLKKYPNLNILLSWTLTSNYLFDKKGKVNQKWIDLVIKYSDRFLIGSDVVGKFGNLGKALKDEKSFLTYLPEDIAKKIAYENALRLFP